MKLAEANKRRVATLTRMLNIRRERLGNLRGDAGFAKAEIAALEWAIAELEKMTVEPITVTPAKEPGNG